MNTLVIFFLGRDFFIELYKYDQLIDRVEFDDASKNLIVRIGDILNSNSITINDLHRVISVSGPGSFSSIRIVCSTLHALKRVFKNMKCSTCYLNELIVDASNLLIRLNNSMFLLFDNGKWVTILEQNLDLSKTYKVFEEYDIQAEQELITNVGKKLKDSFSNEIKKPLYVYMPVI
ncbi:MAG: hypothetical protein H6845_01445 [Alphaproteobacteria bacterium]|nr:MAG: hypothetical protein H6845_01445 [Alphaproteobacteria bacterium]